MPKKSRTADVYDSLADILSTTMQEQVAMKAWRAMRNLNVKGALFLVKPRFLEDHSVTVRLDEIADQVYRQLDAGLPYSKVASMLRVDGRRVRRLKAIWDGLPLFIKEEHRRVWMRTQRRQGNLLEMGRDEGHRRVLLRRTSIAE